MKLKSLVRKQINPQEMLIQKRRYTQEKKGRGNFF
jgi:hypothetical protein